MSLVVSTLTAYVNETEGIVRKAIMEGNTPSMVTVMPGIKSAKTINLLDGSMQLYAGGSCGAFVNSGTTNLTQVKLTVADVTGTESICLQTLEDYYTQTMMRPGSYNEQIPFEDIFVADRTSYLSKEIDKQIWQGNIASGSGNLALVNGILQYVDSAAISGSCVNVTASAFTVSTAIAIVDELVTNIPTDIADADNLTLFVSHSEFQKYLLGLKNANYFHFAPDFDLNQSIKHPGSSVTVMPVTGLVGSTRHILTPASNIVVGTDLLDDYENFDMWYERKDDAVDMRVKYKLAAVVAVPAFVVVN